MDRATAIKKLGKLLGENLGYRVDPTAPKQDDRDAAQAALKPAIARRDEFREAQDRRRLEVLAADPEYRYLKGQAEAASAHVNELSAATRHFKITVGTSGPMFFRIEAQGDSWEQVISTIAAAQQRRAS